MDIAQSEQADHPVAQVLALQKHEDDEHEDDASCGDRLNQWPDIDGKRLQRCRRRLVHLDWDWSRRLIGSRSRLGATLLTSGCGPGRNPVDLTAEVAHEIGRAIDDTLARGSACKLVGLQTQIGFVGR